MNERTNLQLCAGKNCNFKIVATSSYPDGRAKVTAGSTGRGGQIGGQQRREHVQTGSEQSALTRLKSKSLCA